ncbi:MAG: hypothetical protein HN576_13590, partial [Bacteriovoracaceae bacterium]|nr:hypothetical protein [Bacteriovoracaceae bacterium]
RQLLKGLLGNDSIPSKAWKKLNHISNSYKFDFEKYKFLKAKYIEELLTTEVKNLDFQKTPEGILALGEAINKDITSILDPELAGMSFLKRRKLERLVRSFESIDKPDLEHVEDLVANVYSTVLGNKFRLSHLMDSKIAKNKIMTRIVQQELLTQGLVSILSKNQNLLPTKRFLKKFMNSYKGKYLATMLFNLPVLAGFPPLYLPGLKQLKVPPELAREILEKGFTEEMMQKLNIEVLKGLKIKLEYRTGYELLRRYYMIGISIYLSYVILDEFYEGDKIRQENFMLEEVARDMNSILDQAEVLQSRGIDIFGEDEATEFETVDPTVRTEFQMMDNPFCRAMKECLIMHKEDTGEEALTESRPYKECKTFMDPDDKCPDY